MTHTPPPSNDTLPNAQGAAASLICGIVGLLCFPLIPAIVAVVLGHKARGRIAQSNGGLGGGGLAIGGLVTGYLGIAAGLVAILVAAFTIPAIMGAKEKAQETMSLSNVRQITMMVMMEASDNNGTLPADLQQLYQSQGMDPTVLTSPFGGEYSLIGRGRLYDEHNQNSGEAILVIESIPSKKGNFAVGFLDGHVESWNVDRITPGELLEQEQEKIRSLAN